MPLVWGHAAHGKRVDLTCLELAMEDRLDSLLPRDPRYSFKGF